MAAVIVRPPHYRLPIKTLFKKLQGCENCVGESYVRTLHGMLCLVRCHVQALVKAIVLRMRKTLEDDVFMPLYPKQ